MGDDNINDNTYTSYTVPDTNIDKLDPGDTQGTVRYGNYDIDPGTILDVEWEPPHIEEVEVPGTGDDEEEADTAPVMVPGSLRGQTIAEIINHVGEVVGVGNHLGIDPVNWGKALQPTWSYPQVPVVVTHGGALNPQWFYTAMDTFRNRMLITDTSNQGSYGMNYLLSQEQLDDMWQDGDVIIKGNPVLELRELSSTGDPADNTPKYFLLDTYNEKYIEVAHTLHTRVFNPYWGTPEDLDMVDPTDPREAAVTRQLEPWGGRPYQPNSTMLPICGSLLGWPGSRGYMMAPVIRVIRGSTVVIDTDQGITPIDSYLITRNWGPSFVTYAYVFAKPVHGPVNGDTLQLYSEGALKLSGTIMNALGMVLTVKVDGYTSVPALLHCDPPPGVEGVGPGDDVGIGGLGKYWYGTHWETYIPLLDDDLQKQVYPVTLDDEVVPRSWYPTKPFSYDFGPSSRFHTDNDVAVYRSPVVPLADDILSALQPLYHPKATAMLNYRYGRSGYQDLIIGGYKTTESLAVYDNDGGSGYEAESLQGLYDYTHGNPVSTHKQYNHTTPLERLTYIPDGHQYHFSGSYSTVENRSSGLQVLGSLLTEREEWLTGFTPGSYINFPCNEVLEAGYVDKVTLYLIPRFKGLSVSYYNMSPSRPGIVPEQLGDGLAPDDAWLPEWARIDPPEDFPVSLAWGRHHNMGSSRRYRWDYTITEGDTTRPLIKVFEVNNPRSRGALSLSGVTVPRPDWRGSQIPDANIMHTSWTIDPGSTFSWAKYDYYTYPDVHLWLDYDMAVVVEWNWKHPLMGPWVDLADLLEED